MQIATVPSLLAWESFYTIIGSAAAALTGLMFVVITLIMGSARDRVRSTNGTIAAFGTPTVVHFCVALLIAATLSAPWQVLWNAGIVLGLAGLGGVTYIIIVVRRARQQTDYKPVLEDWLWHTIFPLISYIVLVIGAFLISIDVVQALFGIGAVAVLLLFIGIHNAWDTVTYVAISEVQPENQSQDQG